MLFNSHIPASSQQGSQYVWQVPSFPATGQPFPLPGVGTVTLDSRSIRRPGRGSRGPVLCPRLPVLSPEVFKDHIFTLLCRWAQQGQEIQGHQKLGVKLKHQQGEAGSTAVFSKGFRALAQ